MEGFYNIDIVRVNHKNKYIGYSGKSAYSITGKTGNWKAYQMGGDDERIIISGKTLKELSEKLEWKPI